jgi:hypothetical protein
MSNREPPIEFPAAELRNHDNAPPKQSGSTRLMRLRGLKSAWKVGLVSYGVWIFIAFMSGFSMYRFNLLFWKPSASFWDELKIPLINDLIFATFTPIVLLISLRHPIERFNWRWRSLQYSASLPPHMLSFACWFIR